MGEDPNDDPFAVSHALMLALRSHTRLRRIQAAGDSYPSQFEEDELQVRERALDELAALIPRQEIMEDQPPEVTERSVLRAMRDEVLVDLCRRPSGKKMIGAAVSVALRAQWVDEGD